MHRSQTDGQPQDDAFRSILRSHVQRYPAMRPADLYKLFFQGTLGSEHAKADREVVVAALEREAETMGDGPAEPMVDPIGLEPVVVRVHLRPFLAQGGQLSDLAGAFLVSMSTPIGSREQLADRLEAAGRLAREGALPFDPEPWALFCQEMAAQGYPAVHHSAAYREAYRPAYRVIVGGF
ncbi:MAG: hypothetical protein JW797_13645 [Bradymonadales bacterium]|nr:hypothetical protein [Bradymonadales bacterium]